MNDALIREIEMTAFAPVRFRVGYDVEQVDDFLDTVCSELRRGENVLSLVSQARFTPSRRGGYEMGDVDRLLGRIAGWVEPGDARAPLAEDARSHPSGVVQETRGLLSRILRR